MRAQDCACPFPDATKLSLASERTAVGSYRNRVPVEEAGIGVTEIDKERGGGSSRWGCFLNTVIDKVSIRLLLAFLSILYMRSRVIEVVKTYPLTAGTLLTNLLCFAMSFCFSAYA